MKTIKHTILNLIVVAICFASILGYFFGPLVDANVKLTFTEELASKVFTKPSDDASDEEKLSYTLITELAKQNVSFNLSLKIGTDELINCALSSGIDETKKLLLNFTDSIAEHLGKEKKGEIESAITKASVSTVVKMEIEKFAEEVGKEVEDILTDIGVNNEYVNQQTQTVLDAVKAEDATVDSVTDTVISVIDDVYDKLEDSSYADEVESLTPEEKEDLKQNVKDILSNIADENGNIDGEDLISTLLSQLMAQGETETDGENPEDEIPVSMPIRFNSAEESQPDPDESQILNGESASDIKTEDSELVTTLKTEFAKIITDDVCSIFKQILTIALYSLAFSVAFWLWVVLKILFKITSDNPLVKLRAPILFGWSPFIALYVVPTVFMNMLSAPPAFLVNLVGAETLSFVSSILGSGAAAFTTSAVCAVVCAVVLFIFSLYYASIRRRLKKQLKNSPKSGKKSKRR